MGRPVMIEAAINGNALRELNPNIPYSPEEIANDAIATCRAGAALIHFHVRDPQTGRWVQDVPYYSEVYRRTRAVCDPLLWPTFPFDGTPANNSVTSLSWQKIPSLDQTLVPPDMGSVNLATYSREVKKIRGANFVYQNSYETCRQFLEMSRKLGLRPTLQVFEPGFLRAALVFLDQGLLTEPLILKFYFGGKEQNFWLATDSQEPRGVPRNDERGRSMQLVRGDAWRRQFAARTFSRKLGRARTRRSRGLSIRARRSAYEPADSRTRRGSDHQAMGHQAASSKQARELLEV